jgi:hypothetical protein
MSNLWLEPGPEILKGKRVLLAMEPSSLNELLSPLLTDAGALPRQVGTLEEAVHTIQFSPPDFVILCAGFTTHHPLQNPLLNTLQKMPAANRRNLFLVWISAEAKTKDYLSAFALSVHLTVHPDYLESLADLINDSWKEWKELYQVFLQTQEEVTR